MTDQPHNLDAEETVLGAMMLGTVEPALDILEPDGDKKFYREQTHAPVYRAIRTLHRHGSPVDYISVIEQLKTDGELDTVSEERVRELAILVPAAGNVAHHARIVKDHWATRQVLAVVRKAETALLEGIGASEALDRLEQAVANARMRTEDGSQTEIAPMFTLAQNLEERVRNPPSSDDDVPAPFSFQKPMKPGRLYVLGGYTAQGKTAVAVQYAKAVAKRGMSVGFFSIEMSKDQLYDRIISSFGVPVEQIEKGQVAPQYREILNEAIGVTSQWRIDVIDDVSANASTVARVQRIKKYDLVIVDHLHQIILPGDARDRRQALEDQVHGFTNIARQQEVPVLLLAQLSRPSSGNTSYPKPTMAMLRETSRIEQQAWEVCFIFRETDNEGNVASEAEFITSKNRSGPTGVRPLTFIPHETRFTEKTEGTRYGQ